MYPGLSEYIGELLLYSQIIMNESKKRQPKRQQRSSSVAPPMDKIITKEEEKTSSRRASQSHLLERLNPPATSNSDGTSSSYRYVSTQDRESSFQLKKGGQVNYGPAESLTEKEKQDLQTHYGVKDGKNEGVLERKDQYNSKHKTYVNAAHATGRRLTEQEAIAQKTGKQAPNASINHVIASGSGQNIINHETLRFNQGRTQVEQSKKLPSSEKQKAMQSGIAHQAAAVGRVQGLNRAIINERHGESLAHVKDKERIYGGQKGQIDSVSTRNQSLQHTLTAFQGDTPDLRKQAYRDVLKMTYDSPGNLRVGDEYGNNQASTGFDAPLNCEEKPTERADRLLEAYKTYVPDHLENRIFTVDPDGKRVSSSQATPNSKKRKWDGDSSPPNKKKH
jgi:hypothetical protein